MFSKEMRDDLVRGLLDIFKDDIIQIILYGSVARNEAKEDSDIDIAVILRTGMDEIKKESFVNLSVELDLKYEKVFSIVDIESEKINAWGNVLPYYKKIKEEGVLLWSAA